MSATSTINGKPTRKQLADQLDRLDGIIDALADGLQQAVADAAREGTRLAVKDAIIEIMTNPDLRALLVAHVPAAPPSSAAPPPANGPAIWARVKAKVAAARTAARAAVGRRVAGVATWAKEAVVRRFAVAGGLAVALGRATGEPLPLRPMLAAGLGTGLVVGAVCLLAPQAVAAAVGGVGAGCAAIAVQTGRWLTRAARRVGLLS
jgi:hypothetical protein